MINTKKYEDESIDFDLAISKTNYGIKLYSKADPSFYMEIDEKEAIELRDFLLKEFPS